MKKAILTFGLVLTGLFALNVTVSAQGTGAAPQKPAIAGAEISFDKEVHDYGKIEQHGDGACEFTITNTGSQPLIISNAKGSCGCTVPSWSREPIAPGATSTIKVKYDTKRIGLINKTVTITSNATNSPNAVVRIKGEVLNPAAGASPEIKPAGPVNTNK